MELIERIAHCIEFGKINKAAPFPPDLRGQDGADELTRQALDEGIEPDTILKQGMIIGMERVGQKFSENKIFVPQMLMAAKAMNAAMEHIKPFFQSGNVKRKGTFIIGTVKGDLHDIGKNLVSMMVEGNGFEVIDLGVDVPAEKFLDVMEKHPDAVIGLSALLTTTMVSMEEITRKIKEKVPATRVCIGGAPVNQDFCNKINADLYSPNPQGLVTYLNKLAS